MGLAPSRSRSTRSTTPHETRTVPVNMHAGEYPRPKMTATPTSRSPLEQIPVVSGARRPTRKDNRHADTKPHRQALGFITAYADRPHRSRRPGHPVHHQQSPGRRGVRPTDIRRERGCRRRSRTRLRHIPVVPGQIHDEDIANFSVALAELEAPVLAFCRTGTRSASLWALSAPAGVASSDLLSAARAAGYDLDALKPRLDARRQAATHSAGRPRAAAQRQDVVIIGGGAAGLATAASLLRRRPGLDIAVIEPADRHFYQPGWTLVGCGVFSANATMRPMASIMPKGVRWQRIAVEAFEPEHDRIVLADRTRLTYRVLVAAPGLKLDWGAIPDLDEALGKNGGTSNYRFDLAPYTWELVQKLGRGTALFTQPPMPIKCAGAPQKAMYLSCDHWRRAGRIDAIDVEFHNAGGILFGVKEYVPALMHYIERYGIDLKFQSRLVAVNGPAQEATFAIKGSDGGLQEVTRRFDLLHVCPPQTAPDFVRSSPLAGDAGWLDVDHRTLRHTRFENVFSLGDVCSAPNAKTGV